MTMLSWSLVLLRLAAAQSAASGSDNLENCGVAARMWTRGLSLLQRTSSMDQVSVEDMEAFNARFLIQATFGPTRAGLDALQRGTYEGWVTEQVGLATESHREFYRQRTNPRFGGAESFDGGQPRSPCAPGSRWHRFAVTSRDRSKRIEVRSSKLFVDGRFRTDVQGSPLASSWIGLGNYSGFVCYVREGVGSDVHIAPLEDCAKNKKAMPNPALWLSSSEGASSAAGLLIELQARPDVFLAEISPGATCMLEASDSDVIVQYKGEYFRHDARLDLAANTLESPSRRTGTCVPRHPINERSCKLPKFVKEVSTVAGLSMEIRAMRPGTIGYISSTNSGELLAEVLAKNVDYPDVTSASSPFPQARYFAARWTGTIQIQLSGNYDFWLDSNDGSRLAIDDELLIANDGFHSMNEVEGSLVLDAGSHAISLDYFQGKGSSGGIVLRWRGPDSNGEKVVVPEEVFSTQFRAFADGCYVACGSPGEVANEAAMGHHFQIYSTRRRRFSLSTDRYYDNRYAGQMGSDLTKSTTWVAKALGAKDQLRQRMAWGLSQIFVVSVQGFGEGHLSEAWLTFYDILVRGALGNFGDVLREITHSPLMGRYLTHTGSSSFAHDGKHPNENYAREIMQLFTIGLKRLSSDGAPLRDESETTIPSYDNQQILNFARVFTGFVEQPGRANIELDGSHKNLIDPLRMNVERHDVFPKPDLEGKYLGDGFPMCTDSLPDHAYLTKGARFEFRGFSGPAGTLKLSPGSALFEVLCGAPDEASCNFSPVVVLEQALECEGAECEEKELQAIVVGGAYYTFMRPICVHLSIRDSLPQVIGGSDHLAEPQSGFCVDDDGADIKKNVYKLDSLDGNDQERHEECLAKCRSAGGTGCELVWGRWNKGCYVHTRTVAAGSGRSNYMCWGFNATVDALLGHSYELSTRSTAACPLGAVIQTVSECRQAVHSMGLAPAEDVRIGSSDGLPTGCSWQGTYAQWNVKGEGRQNDRFFPLCRAHVTVDGEGNIDLPDGGSKLAVPWLNGVPVTGAHLVSTSLQPVFDRLPTQREVQAELFLGAHRPSDACFVCSGEVKAYEKGGNFGIETIFELDGKFFKNAESIVRLADDGHTFRNPPVFLRSTFDDDAERFALAEVEALLDHLFRHSNTPVFIGMRLIQRFTTSNPPAQYISDVSEAFRQGSYGGHVYSGMYGDLAATAAAILLHPEARSQQGSEGRYQGALREPLLKLMHFMRAMEYTDVADEPVVFRRLQEVIGQFPFEAPTVFNFFQADYELPMQAGPEPESESEEEEEELGHPVQAHVSPEFQIFTPAYFVGYLNGMASLVQSGVSEDCDSSDAAGLGIRVSSAVEGRWRDICPQGRLSLQEAGSMEQTLDQLDMLLTGGRLGVATKDWVRSVYRRAATGERHQKMQQAIAMTAEFNTLGDPLPLAGERAEVLVESSPTRRPYKAMVMLFLKGGADTFNMLVPHECELYQEYLDARTDLALGGSELIKISTSGQACNKFGIHASFPFVKGLYDQGQAAFVSNVGNLARPTTKEQVSGSKAGVCFGLFSHSDQQNGAQTLKCQDFGTAARGAGGRIADALSAGDDKYSTTSFSLAGTAVWSEGVETRRQIVDEKKSVAFSQYEEWRRGISNITAQRHGNAYSEEYAKAFLQAIESASNLGRILDAAELKTSYPTDTTLARQLQQVAKLISTHEGRQSERDFFFVSTGGWDMHSNMKENLATRFKEIDDALRAFVAELKAQGLWERVVLYTASEFGRTLLSNGGGSDHAWAGNHIVVGGGLRGGRVLNKFPTSLAEGIHNLGRGRLIPEYPWESMLVPMATWMGLQASSVAEVFPNFGHFNSTHILAESDLFRS